MRAPSTPAPPAPDMPATGANTVTAIINGLATTYRVRSAGQGVRNLVIAAGKHEGQQLSALIG